MAGHGKAFLSEGKRMAISAVAGLRTGSSHGRSVIISFLFGYAFLTLGERTGHSSSEAMTDISCVITNLPRSHIRRCDEASIYSSVILTIVSPSYRICHIFTFDGLSACVRVVPADTCTTSMVELRRPTLNLKQHTPCLDLRSK